MAQVVWLLGVFLRVIPEKIGMGWKCPIGKLHQVWVGTSQSAEGLGGWETEGRTNGAWLHMALFLSLSLSFSYPS